MNKFLKYIIFFLLGIVLYYFLMQTIQGQKVVEGFGVQSDTENTGLNEAYYGTFSLGNLFISNGYTVAKIKTSSDNTELNYIENTNISTSFDFDSLLTITNKGYTYNPDIYYNAGTKSPSDITTLNNRVFNTDYQEILGDKSFLPISLKKPKFLEDSFILNISSLDSDSGGASLNTNHDLFIGTRSSDMNDKKFYLVKSGDLSSTLSTLEAIDNDTMKFPINVQSVPGDNTDSTRKYIYVRMKDGSDINSVVSTQLTDITDYIILYLKDQDQDTVIPKLNILMKLSICNEFSTTDSAFPDSNNEYSANLGFSSVYSSSAESPPTFMESIDIVNPDDDIKSNMRNLDWVNQDTTESNSIKGYINSIFQEKQTLSSSKSLDQYSGTFSQNTQTNIAQLYHDKFIGVYQDKPITEFMKLIDSNDDNFDTEDGNMILTTSENYSDIDILRILNSKGIITDENLTSEALTAISSGSS